MTVTTYGTEVNFFDTERLCFSLFCLLFRLKRVVLNFFHNFFPKNLFHTCYNAVYPVKAYSYEFVSNKFCFVPNMEFDHLPTLNLIGLEVALLQAGIYN